MSYPHIIFGTFVILTGVVMRLLSEMLVNQLEYPVYMSDLTWVFSYVLTITGMFRVIQGVLGHNFQVGRNLDEKIQLQDVTK